QRAHQRLFLKRIADADLTVGRDEFLRHRLSDSLLNEQASNGGAALAGGPDGAEQDSSQGEVEVRVVHDDHAVVAAQLQQSSPEAAAHSFGNDASGAARTGGADERNPWVFEQAIADILGADHQAQHTLPAVPRKHAIADVLPS